MRKGGVVAFGVLERLDGQHAHDVSGNILTGLIAAVPDGRASAGKVPLGPLDPTRAWLTMVSAMR